MPHLNFHIANCVKMVAVWLCLNCIFVSIPAYAGANEQASEYDLKAALLVKITAFVSWPEDEEIRSAHDVEAANASGELESTKAQPQTLRIAIIGDDPFGEQFDALLVKASTEDRKLVALRVASLEEAKDCQLLYVSPSLRDKTVEILPDLKSGVLTIADFPGFAEAGGMMEMALDGNRISLVINQKSVRDAGLSVSSKLLSLARVIGGNGAGNDKAP